jgi:flagellar protein FlbD
VKFFVLSDGAFCRSSVKERSMKVIEVTRLDNSMVLINVEQIQALHAAPDTVITFTNNVKMIVRESVDEISRRITEYQRAVHTSHMIEPRIPHDFSNSLQ